ncbi:hypothetical protein [Salinibacillus xinjiangensis]|uniref:Uncharacterized protein n=1 Tax=Salinibacillus xinjiangensis TaxID=1229268 RepID=A0A6G1X4U3_9BACI|nr:hypothetical protein [Salinibacillus xinjiangensis]MRG85925.1 hypothetical protein [Salinibacillus xinjiangensis]
MITKRHLLFNLALILLPWITVLFLQKKHFKRFSLAGVCTIVLELMYQVIGQKRNWWVFYDKPKSFVKDVLPFAIGPYMPLSMWLLRLSYGNFKKFLVLNIIADGLFAFPGIKFLKKIKIANLNRLSSIQFFFYLFHKAFILYGMQYLVERNRRTRTKGE